MSLTVATVLWEGDFRTRTYNPEWVRRMRNMVKRNLGSHRFVCLSNVEVDGVETIPLEDDLPGWWSKIELFREPIDDRVLYIDLDSVITDSLHYLAYFHGDFVTAPHSVYWQTDKSLGCSSCVMAWSGDSGRIIYDRFKREYMDRYRGDQDWIADVIDNDVFPQEWFCKLKNCPEGPPHWVKVVACMPWKNDVAVDRFPWVRELWR